MPHWLICDVSRSLRISAHEVADVEPDAEGQLEDDDELEDGPRRGDLLLGGRGELVDDADEDQVQEELILGRLALATLPREDVADEPLTDDGRLDEVSPVVRRVMRVLRRQTSQADEQHTRCALWSPPCGCRLCARSKTVGRA